MNHKQLSGVGRLLLASIAVLFATTMRADVSALAFSPSTIHAGDAVTVTPTITSVPEGTVYVCWGVYTDAGCTSEIDTIAFSNQGLSANAVTFTAPVVGTYYVKCTLRTGGSCSGLVDTYNSSSFSVVPADETPTGVEEVTGAARARKELIDGALYIVKDGKRFDAQGVRVQ